MKFNQIVAYFFILTFITHKNCAIQKKTAKATIFKITNFYCNYTDQFLEKFLYKNSTCYFKIWNRRVPTINLYLGFTQPLNKVFIEVKLNYKRSDNDDFKKVLQTPKFELCYTISSSTDNNLIKKVMEIVKKSFPEFHGCPYTSWTAKNATVADHPFWNFLTSGFYHAIIELNILGKDTKDVTFHVDTVINSVNDRLKGN
ncbi:hypothetical protein PVAND_017218 [Polypedilum vanderplanki]|uniref:Uncharacterized protein n=1 Tax=Polypedilum vanderplanki TaxID=319348 RepID=A0A9J6BHZ9_POLVA|nr:hypothetical protein PVAND_017218 [Polypedilum vanderplanki]